MANHALTTTGPQEAALTHVVTVSNAERVARGLPTQTNTEYVQQRLRELVVDYARVKLRQDARDKLTPAEIEALGLRQ